MENASKAIVIAGTLLISMITISLFVFVFGQISIFTENTEEDTQQTEVIDFNKGFEAYNKKLMYGVDVISVLNKAIDNNIKYEVTEEYDSEYYVNIKVILKEDLETRIEKYRKTTIGYEKESTDDRVHTVMKKNQYYSMNDELQFSKIKEVLIDLGGRSG